MSQITITTTNQEKSEALVQFLRTLDYVEVKSIEPDPVADKQKSVAEFRKFLKDLPERPHRQSDVNRAIKEDRRERGYN